ncbi:hypothetical protein QFC20_005953 [Naganishia adeliensis]|uniref:Uncharacterized protein n=1 Tax=Naganishia adeliensis TaxID=92952 RepID=A0ACC2VGZ6_9TREE|nr:hypothetical protein QFC20_005953 [Naganishia adeliensis]
MDEESEEPVVVVPCEAWKFTSDDEYTPAFGDPAVITDIVRVVWFSYTGRVTSIADMLKSKGWVASWDYDGDVEAGANRFKIDCTNLTIEFDELHLMKGARATDILNGMWLLLPRHDEREHMFELEIAIPTWQVARVILNTTTKVYDHQQVNFQSRQLAKLFLPVWDDVSPKIKSAGSTILGVHGKLAAQSYFRGAPPGLDMNFVVTIDKPKELPRYLLAGEKGFQMTVEFYGKEEGESDLTVMGGEQYFCRSSPNPAIIEVERIRR